MNLLIDIGNSSLKATFAQQLELGAIEHYSGSDQIGFIQNLIDQAEGRGERIDVIAISDVTNRGEAYFTPFIERCNKLIVVDGKTPLPIECSYTTPESLGSDRLMAVVGAVTLFPGEDLLVFDFGTALTVEFVERDGKYIGGNISPGLKMRFDALNQYATALPKVEIPDEVVQIGSSTLQAIESGVVLGLIFEVERYIEDNIGYTYIFTGGGAKYFEQKVKSSIFVVCELIMVGLARIANDYA